MATTNLGKVVGDSAYEVAVSQGYVGTESEWLASLVGPAGEDGTNGVDGFSPVANVVKTGSVATITITDSIGTTTASVYDGSGASLVAGSGIDITGDTISNTAPYSDDAVLDIIDETFGMGYEWEELGSGTTNSSGYYSLMSEMVSPDYEGVVRVYFSNSQDVYMLDEKVEDVENGYVVWRNSDNTNYRLAQRYSNGGSFLDGFISVGTTGEFVVNDKILVQLDAEFIPDDVWNAIDVKWDEPAIGTGLTYGIDPVTGDTTLAVDTSSTGVAMKSDLPSPDGVTLTASNNVWSASIPTVSVVQTVTQGTEIGSVNGTSLYAPAFTESDPIFAASAAATITASDISTWNSIVGVPTATASDEGKALVVTDSLGTIGWDSVGGGSNTVYIDFSKSSKGDIMSQVSSSLYPEIKKYRDDPANTVSIVFRNLTNKEWFYFAGKDLNNDSSVNWWCPSNDRTINASFHGSTGELVSLYYNINQFNQLSPGYLVPGVIKFNQNVHPNPNAASGVYNVNDGFQWIHNNFPTPDGTTITTSGNVWSAVGGGSSLTVSGGANISVNTVSDVATVSLNDSIVLTDSEGHTTTIGADDLVHTSTGIAGEEGEEVEYTEFESTLTDDFLSITHNDEGGNEIEVVTVEPSGIILTSFEIDGENNPYEARRGDIGGGQIDLNWVETPEESKYFGSYGTTEASLHHYEYDNDSEYESASIGLLLESGNEGLRYYINDGNGTEHEGRLWMDTDGSLIYTLDGNNHVLYNGGGM